MSLVDKVFGNSPEILSLRAQRSALITSNLANADTPGFKAKDIDFESTLQNARNGGGLERTHGRHLATDGSSLGIDSAESSGSLSLKYRVPDQPRLDGNTVETDKERMAFLDNAMRYQATVSFLDGRIRSIVSTLRGE